MIKVHPKVAEVAVRSARHIHEYGFYVTLAWFQHEFWFLVGAGAGCLVLVSCIQIFINPDID